MRTIWSTLNLFFISAPLCSILYVQSVQNLGGIP